jgi:hypothetical protein
MSVPGLRKPPSSNTPRPPGRSAAPPMPGTEDVHDDLDFSVRPPAPPLKSGDYVCRLSTIRIPPKPEDGSARQGPRFVFAIVDEKEKQKLNRGEPTYYGEEIDFEYPLQDSGWKVKQAQRFVADMGYPASMWPEAQGQPGRKNLGLLIKQMREELCGEPQAQNPTFKVTIACNEGKGLNKGRMFTNITGVERIKKKTAVAEEPEVDVDTPEE